MEKSASAHITPSLLFIPPKLALLLALLLGLLTMAAYHYAMPAAVGAMNISPLQDVKRSLSRSVIASYGIYREYYTPDLKNPQFFNVTVPVWRFPGKGHVRLRVHPEGCILEVFANGKPILFDPAKQLCIGSATRQLEGIDAWLEPGLNTLRFTLAATAEGKASVRLHTAASNKLLFVGLFLTFGCLLLSVLRRLDFTEPIVLMMLFGLFCCMTYYFGVDYMSVSPDISGHLEYIDHLLANRRVPPPLAGWQLYHPPLYYAICAIAYAAWNALSPGDPYWAARFITLVMYQGFLIFSLLIIRRAAQ
jgi:hypothetical protein